MRRLDPLSHSPLKLVGTTKGHGSKSQKTQSSYIFASKYTQVPKDHMPEKKKKFWKTSIIINKFGSNCHAICQASRDTIDQSSDFFYKCNFSEVIWHGAQITKLFWINIKIMSFQVCILQTKTNFHVIFSKNGYIH